MLRIGDIIIVGFGSILGPFKYRFDKPGLNLIKGDVGAGKTTIIDALNWALFGVKTKKKSGVEPWPQLITPDYKGTMVEVNFTKGPNEYKLIRCSEYKGKILGKVGKDRLILVVNGKEDTSIKKVGLKNEVQKILGYSPELFRSTILFGQGVDKFMQEDSPTKKKILEEAFLVKHITVAQDKAKELFNKHSREFENLNSEVSILKLKYHNAKNLLKSTKDNLKLRKKEKKERLAKLSEIIKNLSKYPALYEELKVKVDKLKDDLSKARKELQELNSDKLQQYKQDKVKIEANKSNTLKDLKRVEEELAHIKSNPGKCPTCGKPKDNTKAILKLENRIASLIVLRESQSGSIISLENKINARISKYANKVDTLNASIKLLEKSVGIEEKQLNNAYTHKVILSNTLKSYNEEMDALIDTDLSNLTKQRKLAKQLYKAKLVLLKPLKAQLEDYKWLIKDPLSNSGLKALIFDTMLAKLNQRLLKYQTFLGFTIQVGINLQSANKDVIISIKKRGDEVPSNDLSGGEKQLTNLAIGLSFHETQTENNPINILVLDECFEGLNEKGIQQVADLLRNVAKTKAVHLVTHRNFNPLNAQVVELEKNSKGVTEILTKYRSQ